MKGLHPSGPKQNRFISGLGASVFYMLPLKVYAGYTLKIRYCSERWLHVDFQRFKIMFSSTCKFKTLLVIKVPYLDSISIVFRNNPPPNFNFENKSLTF